MSLCDKTPCQIMGSSLSRQLPLLVVDGLRNKAAALCRIQAPVCRPPAGRSASGRPRCSRPRNRSPKSPLHSSTTRQPVLSKRLCENGVLTCSELEKSAKWTGQCVSEALPAHPYVRSVLVNLPRPCAVGLQTHAAHAIPHRSSVASCHPGSPSPSTCTRDPS